jgi:hypothetical protein
MSNTEDRIKKLEEKLRQERALLQQEAARKRAKEDAALAADARREDTRRKVLVGAFVQDQLAKSGGDLNTYTVAGLSLQDWLTRDDERALFGLPSRG